MLNSFRLKAGRAPDGRPFDVAVAAVNVFVGPNNSGKSLVLQEIVGFLEVNRNVFQVLDSLEFSPAEFDDLDPLLTRLVDPDSVRDDPRYRFTFGRPYAMSREHLQRRLRNPEEEPHVVRSFWRQFTVFLTGADRAQVEQREMGNLQAPPQNTHQVLFRDDQKRAHLRKILRAAFGRWFVLNPTQGGQLRPAYSDVEPTTEERRLDDAALAFHGATTPIEEMSDGVRAFTRLMLELVAGDPRILLIDEPEAFLHPALAFRIGAELATAAVTDKCVFVSTHSAPFISGCVHSGAAVNIVRLTYQSGVATARTLPSDDLLELMRDPLLRSAGVLNAIFYSAVVVCESDADRVFYEEINYRLNQADPKRGITDCLFINAQNHQTIRRIVAPLRRLGIPAVGIYDLDTIDVGGVDWTGLMEAAGVPRLEHQSLGNLRATISEALASTGRNMKTDGGIGVLVGEDREAAANLLAKLRLYGAFVVPIGELESWLAHLAVPRTHKSKWIIDILEAMKQTSSDAGYVGPGVGDVWDFIEGVRTWCENPARLGIPE